MYNVVVHLDTGIGPGAGGLADPAEFLLDVRERVDSLPRRETPRASDEVWVWCRITWFSAGMMLSDGRGVLNDIQ